LEASLCLFWEEAEKEKDSPSKVRCAVQPAKVWRGCFEVDEKAALNLSTPIPP